MYPAVYPAQRSVPKRRLVSPSTSASSRVDDFLDGVAVAASLPVEDAEELEGVRSVAAWLREKDIRVRLVDVDDGAPLMTTAHVGCQHADCASQTTVKSIRRQMCEGRRFACPRPGCARAPGTPNTVPCTSPCEACASCSVLGARDALSVRGIQLLGDTVRLQRTSAGSHALVSFRCVTVSCSSHSDLHQS